MRWGFPAALLAVLGLSCGSSSGEEVATDVVAFQPFLQGDGIGVLAIKANADTVEYRSDSGAVELPGLKLRGLMLPIVEGMDGRLLQLTRDTNGPFTPSSIPVPTSIVRCFVGALCQTASGDVVDPDSFGKASLSDLPAVRGASDCDGMFCLVGGRAQSIIGAKVDLVGPFVAVVAVNWASIGGEIFADGCAFLRADGSVATAGYGLERIYVAELVGLPPIRKIHKGGIYEDYSGNMWYLGVAPEEWSDNLVLPEVPRRQCKVRVGKKLSLRDVPCVGPTILPVIEGTKPQVTNNDAFVPILYALDQEGTLRCWSAPGGPACVKGE